MLQQLLAYHSKTTGWTKESTFDDYWKTVHFRIKKGLWGTMWRKTPSTATEPTTIAQLVAGADKLFEVEAAADTGDHLL